MEHTPSGPSLLRLKQWGLCFYQWSKEDPKSTGWTSPGQSHTERVDYHSQQWEINWLYYLIYHRSAKNLAWSSSGVAVEQQVKCSVCRLPLPQERIPWRNTHSRATRSWPNNGRCTDLVYLQNVSICTGIIKQHNSKAQNTIMCTVKKGRLPNSKIMTSCIPDKTFKLVLLNPSSYYHYSQKPS